MSAYFNCRDITIESSRHAREILVHLAWARTRKQLSRMIQKSISPAAFRHMLKKNGQTPMGMCIPKYPAGKKDPEKRGYREFIVLVSGQGSSCLDTLIHEFMHVGMKAFPHDEEEACQVSGTFTTEALTWLARNKKDSLLTPLFHRGKVCIKPTKKG